MEKIPPEGGPGWSIRQLTGLAKNVGGVARWGKKIGCGSNTKHHPSWYKNTPGRCGVWDPGESGRLMVQ